MNGTKQRHYSPQSFPPLRLAGAPSGDTAPPTGKVAEIQAQHGNARVIRSVAPPPGRQFSPDEARRLANAPRPAALQATRAAATPAPAAKPAPGTSSEEERLHPGVDINAGPTFTKTFPDSFGKPPFEIVSFDLTASLVLHRLHQPFSESLDFLHDPSLGLAVSVHGPDPDGVTTNLAVQVTLPLVNYIFRYHGKEIVELLGTAVFGLGTSFPHPGLSFQEQLGLGLEYHLPNTPNASLFFNLSGSISLDALNGLRLDNSSLAVGGGLLLHINP